MAKRKIQVVGAMIEKDVGRYLITQRPKTSSLPLLWEFPGGKVEEGETHEAALARELREEMGIDVAVKERVMHTHHEYEKYEIDFCVYACALKSPESAIQHIRVNDHRWVTLEEMGEFKFPDVDAKTLEKLLGLDT